MSLSYTTGHLGHQAATLSDGYQVVYSPRAGLSLAAMWTCRDQRDIDELGFVKVMTEDYRGAVIHATCSGYTILTHGLDLSWSSDERPANPRPHKDPDYISLTQVRNKLGYMGAYAEMVHPDTWDNFVSLARAWIDWAIEETAREAPKDQALRRQLQAG